MHIAKRPGVCLLVQHYAVKTIENVVSQGGEWAARFASEAVAADLFRWVHLRWITRDTIRQHCRCWVAISLHYSRTQFGRSFEMC